MPLHESIEKVSGFIRKKGHEFEFKVEEPASSADIAETARRLGIHALPPSSVDFYHKFGNGLQIRWLSGEEEDSAFANFTLLPLRDAVDRFLEEKEGGGPVWDDLNDFDGCQCQSLAKETARESRSYLNIIDEGNGDAVSIDVIHGAVRFNSHDWFDGGIGINGLVMAADIGSFLKAWSKRCFQTPKSLDWTTVLGPRGVDWNHEDFDRDFSLQEVVYG